MTRYCVVTTTNAAGWEETGRRMVESFLARWPAECRPLTIYAEGFDPETMDGVEVRRLPAWQEKFKADHALAPSKCGMRSGKYDYRFDAVKFSHKVAALTDFALSLNDGVMVWLDADTFTHADVTVDWLDDLFPSGYLAWLDRIGNHPECGIVMFRASHPYHMAFMERFRDIYSSNDVFKLAETHDSFVLQHIVMLKVGAGKIPPAVSLSGEARNWHHPCAQGPIGAKIDHAKGSRKAEGRSGPLDLRTPRLEPYWAT